ncbi:MAG: VOC family protein [Nitrosomonas sp.]|nr:VOC family protein [Nitrosomonas sp.]
MTVEFTVLGQSFIGLNGGRILPDQAVSFMVLTNDQEETDRYWNAIMRTAAARIIAAGVRIVGFFWQITLKAAHGADEQDQIG